MKKLLLSIVLFSLFPTQAFGLGLCRDLLVGETSVRAMVVRILDNTTGIPDTAITSASSGWDMWYRREGGSKVSETGESDIATPATAYTAAGMVHLSNGYYRLDYSNGAFIAGAKHVLLGATVTDKIVIGCTVQLHAVDLFDAGLGLQLDNNIYQLVGTMVPNDGAGEDQYGVAFLKNGVVTAPSADFEIAVVRVSDGVNLIGSIAAPQDVDGQVGTSGMFEYTEATNRMLNDELYLLYAEGTIDGSTQTDVIFATRDSWKNTLTELSQAAPSATPDPSDALMLLYMALRNKVDVTATTKEIHDDAGVVITKKTLSDDGATYTEAEAESGP